jgi:hypothetical protein
MDRFEMPNYYEEVCQVCKGADCEPVELDGCDWDAVWSCQV